MEEKKALEILVEVAKEKGIDVAEEFLAKVVEVFEVAGPRLAAEAKEPVAKMLGSGIVMILPVLKPVILKAIDLDADGKVG